MSNRRHKAVRPTLPAEKADPPMVTSAFISADDLAYHQRVISTLKTRQAELQAAELVLQNWAGHLVEKYKLTEADSIQEDGSIRRNGSQ